MRKGQVKIIEKAAALNFPEAMMDILKQDLLIEELDVAFNYFQV